MNIEVVLPGIYIVYHFDIRVVKLVLTSRPLGRANKNRQSGGFLVELRVLKP